MGAVHFSIDTQLVEHLKRLLPLKVFVETGTLHGDTLDKVHPFFDKLHSVEVAEKHYRVASQRFEADESVELCLGRSEEFLRRLAPELIDESVLFWLDAHWCQTGDTKVPVQAQCPLLEELAAIGTLNSRSVVLIDDARYFLAPPPEPNDPNQWPRIDPVLEGLRALSSDHEVSVSNDVIIFSPKGIGSELRVFLQSHQFNWLAAVNRAEDSDRQLREITRVLQEAEADRSARAAAIQALREGLQHSEADLRTSEADRADRLRDIHTLQEQLQTSENDRAARLDVICALQEQLQASEADRAARLDVICALHDQLQVSEADRAARLEAIYTLQAQLQASEADRAAGLARKLSTKLMAFGLRRK